MKLVNITVSNMVLYLDQQYKIRKMMTRKPYPSATPILLFTMVIILLISQCNNKLTSFQLTPHRHLLILYSPQLPQYRKLNMLINFNSTQIVLDNQYTGAMLYLDKALKYPISNQNVAIQYRSINKQVQATNVNHVGIGDDKQQIHGIVGLHAQSIFYRSIKAYLNIQHFKLKFRLHQNMIQIIKQPCSHSIKPPYSLQISTAYTTQFIQISQISLYFSINSQSHQFLKLVSKNSNPFVMTIQQLDYMVQIQLLNQVATIPMRSLLTDKCRKISGANSYQCDIQNSNNRYHQNNKNNDDYGVLLFEFDPILCTQRNAIQLRHQGKIDSVGYYWSHLLLICIQIGVMIAFKYRVSLQRRIAYLFKNRKMK